MFQPENSSLLNKYKVQKEDLLSLVSKYQQRDFSEDVDFLEELGGDKAFEELLSVDYHRGIRDEELNERRIHYGTANMEEVPMKSTSIES